MAARVIMEQLSGTAQDTTPRTENAAATEGVAGTGRAVPEDPAAMVVTVAKATGHVAARGVKGERVQETKPERVETAAMAAGPTVPINRRVVQGVMAETVATGPGAKVGRGAMPGRIIQREVLHVSPSPSAEQAVTRASSRAAMVKAVPEGQDFRMEQTASTEIRESRTMAGMEPTAILRTLALLDSGGELLGCGLETTPDSVACRD